MSAGKLCNRSVVIATPDEAVSEAARRMTRNDVGTVVVLDEERRPLGILTDRDITVRCVGTDLDPASTPIESVMTAPVRTVREATSIEDALRTMAGVGARRLVVTDEDDRLVGILALDDVLELLTEEAEAIGRLLSGMTD